MIAVFIEINIKRITDKKRSRSFRPILSCNRRRYFGRKSFFDLFCTRNAQILFRRIGVFILDYHYQVSQLRIFHNSSVNHTEIRVEKHLCLWESAEILCCHIINTMIQSLLAFASRYFLVTTGDGSCPKDIVSLRRFVIKEFRCPTIMGSRLVHHHRNSLLFTPMN